MKKLKQYLDKKIKNPVLKQDIIVATKCISISAVIWGGFAIYYQTCLFIAHQENLIWYLIKTTISAIFVLGGAYGIYFFTSNFIQRLRSKLKPPKNK